MRRSSASSRRADTASPFTQTLRSTVRRNWSSELTNAGHDAAAFGADLRDEDATRAMIDRVRRHFGRLDALVNSAAIWSPTPLESAMADDVRRFFEVNTLSTFVCCQHAGLIMAEQDEGGAIVNIGDWAVERPYRDHSAYFISKGAIPTTDADVRRRAGPESPRERGAAGPRTDFRTASRKPIAAARSLARCLAVRDGRKTWRMRSRSYWKTTSLRASVCRWMAVAL